MKYSLVCCTVASRKSHAISIYLVQDIETKQHKIQFDICKNTDGLDQRNVLYCDSSKRFKNINVTKKPISSSNITKREHMWILHIQKKLYKNIFESMENGKKCSLKQQLEVYIDENGLLRCKGRIENTSLSEAARHSLLLLKRIILHV